MNQSLLDVEESVCIRLGPNKEIVSAPDAVFRPEHQEESRVMIFEAGYLQDYLEEFSELLNMGEAKFAAVSEPGRQTSFRYDENGPRTLALTKAHRSMDRILRDLKEEE